MLPVVHEGDPAEPYHLGHLQVVDGLEQLRQTADGVRLRTGRRRWRRRGRRSSRHGVGHPLEEGEQEVVVGGDDEQPRPEVEGDHDAPQVPAGGDPSDGADRRDHVVHLKQQGEASDISLGQCDREMLRIAAAGRS